MGRRRQAFHTEETTTECSLGIRKVVGDVRRFEARAEARTQGPLQAVHWSVDFVPQVVVFPTAPSSEAFCLADVQRTSAELTQD